MKKIAILIVTLFIFKCGKIYPQQLGIIDLLNKQENKIEECYAVINDDTLVIGNYFIERKYKWSQGELISISLKDKMNNAIIYFNNDTIPDFTIKKLTGSIIESNYSVKTIDKSPIYTQHIELEILNQYKDIAVKRVFRIYPACLAIACDYYLKAKGIQILPEDIYIENLFLPSLHWKLDVIEFFDATDHRNNLTRSCSIIPYDDQESKLRGNILIASNLIDKASLFILKEAPCSFVQNNYPGYDFESKLYHRKGVTELRSVGLGITGNDLTKDNWIKCYGYVTGIYVKTDINKMIAIRSYQKNIRKIIPERDEMIMGCTWGDRNRDEKISEEFIMNEIIQAKELGITHYIIDDGWQQGLSMNSANKGESLWNQWTLDDWQPHRVRFPNSFAPIIKLADSLGVNMGLWFNPSNEDEYKNWQQDADILVRLYKQFGFKYFKIDGVKLLTKQADINLQKFFDRVLKETNYRIVLSLDATADNRYGYHSSNYLGNIFLENRYTDWRNYYPYRTLRNLWLLSKYVPPEKLQVEFLNKWRNKEIYGDDPFTPWKYSFDYVFAITIPGQPLAWFETTGLPEEAFKTADIINKFNSIRGELHKCYIFPIGNEPTGNTCTGFQFINSADEGYILIFRELNDIDELPILTMFTKGQKVDFSKLFGSGLSFTYTVGNDGLIEFNLAEQNSFCLYKYKIIE